MLTSPATSGRKRSDVLRLRYRTYDHHGQQARRHYRFPPSLCLPRCCYRSSGFVRWGLVHACAVTSEAGAFQREGSCARYRWERSSRPECVSQSLCCNGLHIDCAISASIRAYGAQNVFTKQCFDRIDKQTKIATISWNLNRYAALPLPRTYCTQYSYICADGSQCA